MLLVWLDSTSKDISFSGSKIEAKLGVPLKFGFNSCLRLVESVVGPVTLTTSERVLYLKCNLTQPVPFGSSSDSIIGCVDLEEKANSSGKRLILAKLHPNFVSYRLWPGLHQQLTITLVKATGEPVTCDSLAVSLSFYDDA